MTIYKDLKKLFLVVCIFGMSITTLCGCTSSVAHAKGTTEESEVTSKDIYFRDVFPEYVSEAKRYLADNKKLNQEYCILVDYSIPSGQRRVFVWSFVDNRIIYKAHTMHGPGGGSTREHAVLSNKEGSLCSPPGHFLITHDEGVKIKPSFRMKGLDAENKNAYARAIMLHGAALVDYSLRKKEPYLPIDAGWCQGCITTSVDEMNDLKRFIKKYPPNIMIWSFESHHIF